VLYYIVIESFTFRPVRSRCVTLRYVMVCYIMLCYIARGCVLYSWISATALRRVLPFLQNRQTLFYPVDGGSTFFWILVPSCQTIMHLILEYIYLNRHILAAFHCECPRNGTKLDMVFCICVLVINFISSPGVLNLHHDPKMRHQSV